jgi:hypothetical protein
MAPSLTDETRSMLAVLGRSRTAPTHHVERSAIILHLADRRSASETAAPLVEHLPIGEAELSLGGARQSHLTNSFADLDFCRFNALI